MNCLEFPKNKTPIRLYQFLLGNMSRMSRINDITSRSGYFVTGSIICYSYCDNQAI